MNDILTNFISNLTLVVVGGILLEIIRSRYQKAKDNKENRELILDKLENLTMSIHNLTQLMHNVTVNEMEIDIKEVNSTMNKIISQRLLVLGRIAVNFKLSNDDTELIEELEEDIEKYMEYGHDIFNKKKSELNSDSILSAINDKIRKLTWIVIEEKM